MGGRTQRAGRDTFSYALADNLRFLNAADWDGITEGQSLFLSRPYQTALRNAGPRGLQTRYGLIYARDKAVAAVVAHVLSVTAEPAPAADNWTAAAPFWGSAPDGADLIRTGSPQIQKLLICGDLFASGFHGVAFHPSTDLGVLWPAIATFLDRVQHQERFVPDRDCVFIKDVHASLDFETRALRACQFRRVNAGAAMHFSMPERWTCFEDYVDHLNIRHRMGAYRVTREFGRAGIVARPVESVAPLAQRMHELYLSVQRKEGLALAALGADFLPTLTGALGSNGFRCTGLFQGPTLVGYAATLRDRDRAVCYSLGWDREACAGVPMLQALLHAVIADALALRCSEIDFGRTALKAKAQVGAHPHASDIWVLQSTPAAPNWPVSAMEPLSHSPVPDPVLSLSL